jgi:DNA-binding response OmpR family regulator
VSEKIKVMLIDDEVLILECLRIFLEDEGFEVFAFTNAEDALIKISSLTPSTCITDMGLEGLDGNEFIVRAHPESRNTRFMIHTGAFFELTEELRALGMTPEDIIIKPVMDFEVFTDRIRAHAAGGCVNNVT